MQRLTEKERLQKDALSLLILSPFYIRFSSSGTRPIRHLLFQGALYDNCLFLLGASRIEETLAAKSLAVDTGRTAGYKVDCRSTGRPNCLEANWFIEVFVLGPRLYADVYWCVCARELTR